MLLRIILNLMSHSTTDQPVTLDSLHSGQLAVVSEIKGEEPQLVRLRIMGLCIGQGVHVLREGSRMIVCAGGTRIGLAGGVARAVAVRLIDESSVEDQVEMELP